MTFEICLMPSFNQALFERNIGILYSDLQNQSYAKLTVDHLPPSAIPGPSDRQLQNRIHYRQI